MIDDMPVGAALRRNLGSATAPGEAVEREIDAFIEKRAALEDPEANEELWQQSVRRYNARRRKELDLQRYEYHRGQAARLKAVLESLVREHEQNAEKHLPKGA